MSEKYPKISIITPSYNSAKYLKDCINSVIDQNYNNFEHIIVDGESTDDTLSIVKEYPHLKWISEKDEGQSDALNKGFHLATGEIIGWLNADDQYCTKTFHKISKYFIDNPNVDAFYSNFYLLFQSNKKVQKVYSHIPIKWLSLYHCYIPSTTFFFRKEIIDSGILIDKNFKLTMDKEFFAHILYSGYKLKYVNDFFAIFRWHNSNKSLDVPNVREIRYKEGFKVFNRYSSIKLMNNEFGLKIYRILCSTLLIYRKYIKIVYSGNLNIDRYMIILHYLLGRCNPDSANGIEKMVYNMTLELAKNSSNCVILFSLTNKEIISIPNVQIYKFKPHKAAILLPIEIKKKIIECNPDVVHLHSVNNPHNYIISRWLNELNIPYVITAHGGLDKSILLRKKILKLIYKYIIELKLYNGALFVHSVGDTESIRNYGVNNHIVEIPNGINLDVIPKEYINNDILKDYPFLSSKRIVLFVGRLDPVQKGLDVLLKAFSNNNIKNLVLLLVGPDHKDNTPHLKEMISNYDIKDKVLIVGPLFGPKKYNYLNHSDIFIHTSRWEGLSLSVLEAMAMSLPCLLTKQANPIGMLKNGNSGWIVNFDFQEIAKALINAESESKLKLKKMGLENYKIILDSFQWKNIAIDMNKSYKKFINKNQEIRGN